MPNLSDELDDPIDRPTASLRQVRLGQEPAMLMVFTAEFESIRLHYEPDDKVRSYIICHGERCPICFLGSPPADFYLLPVYNLESRAVEVLRISTKRGPETLAAAIRPHLKDPDIANKVLLVSREMARYRVQAKPLAQHSDRGASAITAFIEAAKNGLKLCSAFPLLSPKELSETERIKRKLEAIGGFDLGDGDGDQE